MATYTYLACDLLTREVWAELPLGDVTLGRALSGAGSFGGKLAHLDDPRVAALDPIGATTPGRTTVLPYRDGVLLGEWIVWQRRYSSDRGELELAGAELASYAAHRVTAGLLEFYDVEQLELARELWRRLEAPTGAGLGVELDETASSGVTRDLLVPPDELKTYAEVFEQLADTDDGFEWRLDVDAPTGELRRRLALAARLGRTPQTSDLVFELPGNLEAYEWPEDAGAGANTVHAAGAGEGAAMLRATVADPAPLDAGWPLLEASVAYKDEITEGGLESLARADLDELRVPLVTAGATVRADAAPIVGTYAPGDCARFRMRDPRWPAGHDAWWRILGWSLKAEAEQVTLELAPVPA